MKTAGKTDLTDQKNSNLTDRQMTDLVDLAKSAGEAIMKIYQDGSTEVFEKNDLSPVTSADLSAHRILLAGLKQITPDIPVISEESEKPFTAVGERYWLVDPLDGTRDFIAHLDTFVVCFGLIDRNYPVAGIIHAPVSAKSWWAQSGQGAFADGRLVSNRSQRSDLIAAGSRSTPSARMEAFYEHFHISDVRRYGSALKFCHLSEGEVDLYSRFGPTYEWDTAAGQAIAEEAGCQVIEVASQARLKYGKPDLLNAGGFIASRADLDIVGPLHRDLLGRVGPKP